MTSSQQWPPAPWGTVHDDVQMSSAWWQGSPEALVQAYRGRGSDPYTTPWWGKLPKPGQMIQRTHVPLPADLVQMSANMLFSDPPRFTVADDTNTSAQDRLDMLLNTPQQASALLVAGESCAALGDTYGRIVWDPDIADNAWIDYVDADRAIPTFKWGRMVDCTFWTVLGGTPTGEVWRHLETHKPGRIVHRLFKGEHGHLGTQQPLESHPDTESIGADADGAIATGTDRLTAGHVPNQKPNPAYRDDPQLRHLGRADLSPDILPLFDQLDETMSSLLRDVRQGKGRIVIPEHMLDTDGPGRGGRFDMDQEAFTGVSSLSPDASPSSIQSVQFAIRHSEHGAVVEQLTREIIRRVGYSPLTFGMSDERAQTATEINAKSTSTETTRTAKTRLWSNMLAPLARTLMEVDAYLFRTGVAVGEDVDVEFPPMSQQSDEDIASMVQTAGAAGAMSTDTKVRKLHPDWDDERIGAEVEAIRSEQGMMLPDLGGVSESDFTSSPDGGDDGGDDAKDLKMKADAMGVMIRAGVTSDDAARLAGLPVDFTGLQPVSLRDPDDTDTTG